MIACYIFFGALFFGGSIVFYIYLWRDAVDGFPGWDEPGSY